MRKYLLLLLCASLTGCGHQEDNQREVLGKLEAIKAELAARQATPVRWAFANKSEISAAIAQWNRDKMEEFKKTEALSPETEAKIGQYDALQGEIMRLRVSSFRPRPIRFPGSPEPATPEQTAAEKEIAALTAKAAEARLPIATVMDQRDHQAAKFRDQYSLDRLVAEYVKGRYDLVVNTDTYRGAKDEILYRAAGEVPDITEGVISYFREKTKQ